MQMLFLGLLLHFPLLEEKLAFLKENFSVEIHERSEGVFLGKKISEKCNLLQLEDLKLHLASIAKHFFQTEYSGPLPLFFFTI